MQHARGRHVDLVAGRGQQILARVGVGQFGVDRLAGLAEPRDGRAQLVELPAAHVQVFDPQQHGGDGLVLGRLVHPLDDGAPARLHFGEQPRLRRAFRIVALDREADHGGLLHPGLVGGFVRLAAWWLRLLVFGLGGPVLLFGVGGLRRGPVGVVPRAVFVGGGRRRSC